MSDQSLHAVQVLCEHRAGFGPRQTCFLTQGSAHPGERLRIEAGIRCDQGAERRVIGWRTLGVESFHSSKYHHEGAQARFQELELAPPIAARRQDAATELQQ